MTRAEYVEARPTTACPNTSCVALVQRHGGTVVPCCGPCLDEHRYASTRGLVPRRLPADEHSAKCRENQARRGAVSAP